MKSATTLELHSDDIVVVLTDVQSGGLAHEAGLRSDQRVVSVCGEAVSSAQQATKLITNADSLVEITLAAWDAKTEVELDPLRPGAGCAEDGMPEAGGCGEAEDP